jgi:hypothetical protein
MMSPLSLEILAHDVIREHRHRAAQAALAAALPRSDSPRQRPDIAARQLAADGLRALARRLDPCVACREPQLATAGPR